MYSHHKFIKKSLLILLVTSISFTVSGCKNKKEAANQNTNAVNNSTTPSDANTYSLVLSFYSIGSGSDWDIISELDLYIESFNRASKTKPNIDRIPWGREGEVDFCIQTAEMSKNDKEAFIQKTLEIAKRAKFVHINENAVCRYKR
jgi:hypothetical protein